MDKNKNSMERQITEIIEKYLEGNYLVGSDNKSKMISDILILFNVSQQRELFDAILDFTEDLPMCSEDYNRDTLYQRYIAENCG